MTTTKSAFAITLASLLFWQSANSQDKNDSLEIKKNKISAFNNIKNVSIDISSDVLSPQKIREVCHNLLNLLGWTIDTTTYAAYKPNPNADAFITVTLISEIKKGNFLKEVGTECFKLIDGLNYYSYTGTPFKLEHKAMISGDILFAFGPSKEYKEKIEFKSNYTAFNICNDEPTPYKLLTYAFWSQQFFNSNGQEIYPSGFVNAFINLLSELSGKSIFDLFGKNENSIVKYLKVFRNFSESYNIQGCAFYEKKDYSNALKAFDSAISMDTLDCGYFANRARTKNKLQKYVEACEDMKRAHKLGYPITDIELHSFCTPAKE